MRLARLQPHGHLLLAQLLSPLPPPLQRTTHAPRQRSPAQPSPRPLPRTLRTRPAPPRPAPPSERSPQSPQALMLSLPLGSVLPREVPPPARPADGCGISKSILQEARWVRS